MEIKRFDPPILMLVTIGGAIIVLGQIVNGIAIAALWNWFICPLGVKNLTIMSAIGLSVLGQLILKPDYTAKIKDNLEKWDSWPAMIIGAAGDAIVSPLLSLIFGWIISAFL